MMKILVTGGTGFVGGGLLRRLGGDGGRAVVAAVRAGGAMLPPGIETVLVADLGPDTDWSPALAGVDVVVHCAARAHVMNEGASDPSAVYRRVNMQGTLRLARQAAAAGVRRFMFLSSIGVNGAATSHAPFTADDLPAPHSTYAQSKYDAEQGLCRLAAEKGLEVVIIRPPLVYGPGAKGNFAALMRLVATGMPLPLGAVRHNRRSLVGLDNLVDLIITCLDHPAAANQVLLAADGEDLSTAELLQRLGRAMNRRVRLLPVPVWMLESAAAILGKRDMAQRLLGSLQVDIGKTRELLGWSPPVGVDEGLKRAVEGLRR